MPLYNLRTRDGDFVITKFDADLNVESSYTTTETECTCPAGSRPTCRHRTMLSKMLARDIADSPMFYDFEGDFFVEPLESETNEPSHHPNAGAYEVHNMSRETVLATEQLDEACDSMKTYINNAVHPSIGYVRRRV